MANSTASWSTSELRQFYNSHFAEFYKKETAVDVISKSRVLLSLLSMPEFTTVQPTKAELFRNMLNERQGGGSTAQYYDRLPTAPSPGLNTMKFTRAQYVVPMSVSDQELHDNKGEGQIYDVMKAKAQIMRLAMDDLEEIGLHAGNSLDTLEYLGLEDIYHATTHQGGGTPVGLARWQYRQAANSYGGITRVAHTSTTDGTGLEPTVIDMSAATTIGFAYDSTVPEAYNEHINALWDLYDACTYGGMSPDWLYLGKNSNAQLARTLDSRQILAVARKGYGDIMGWKFMGATVVWGDYNPSYALTGSATPAVENAYFLNSMYHKRIVDSEYNYKLEGPKTPIDQAASIFHLWLWAYQFSDNPRMGGRAYDVLGA